MNLIVNNKPVATDKQGYLSNITDWNAEVANAIAKTESLNLTDDHWLVVHTLRAFYLDFQRLPTMRILVKTLGDKLPSDKANSQFLYELFPDGPIKQGAKIAGLPRPPHCI